MRARFPVAVATLTVVACGGKVVFVDSDESGGAAGTGAAAGGMVSQATSSSSGIQCDLLKQQLDDANRAARACDPSSSVNQCEVLVYDSCGCLALLANPSAPGLVSAAIAAYDAWAASGCEPVDCFGCCVEVSAGCSESSAGAFCGATLLPC